MINFTKPCCNLNSSTKDPPTVKSSAARHVSQNWKQNYSKRYYFFSASSCLVGDQIFGCINAKWAPCQNYFQLHTFYFIFLPTEFILQTELQIIMERLYTYRYLLLPLRALKNTYCFFQHSSINFILLLVTINLNFLNYKLIL